ncbi:SRPBCC domain-containing protein [Trichococcus ilyis]|uniref:Uncharacterized conserved protein YndB, AHSA1/START domain n=1 Tax=Trichococcus ilyis TaxID=640938 RepID=A0A143YBN0_9LACT|nr:SRPBCC domain-containing protein [Trichococcus ilyis]CZQ84946.1 Hypothetical protein TR210_411 [Trichococcus ilyis]SEJ96026.1 Uncharacterized conserved protein YndB, AHSA1/START domain [Trichococcus ilyis]
MYATTKKQNGSTIVEFNRVIPHPISSVWQMLTVNEQLQPGGKIKFDFGNGIYERMTILKVSEPTSFAFSWDKNTMRFELSETADGQTSLKLSEDIIEVTAHTPRDIAGWHACLDRIAVILDGLSVKPGPAENWDDLYQYYKIAFETFLISRKRNRLIGSPQTVPISRFFTFFINAF